MIGGSDPVRAELHRRLDMWTWILAAGGTEEAPAAVLRERGIYGGAQGIWVDKDRTATLTANGKGVTVGLLHTGRHYPDDMSDDGVIYHFPWTNRPPARDANEVEATKNAARLGLPVFVITQRSHSTRKVQLGWVIDWDDESRLFLISFDMTEDQNVLLSAHAPEMSTSVTVDEPFEAFEPPRSMQREIRDRPGQQRFKFAVLKRYGPKCAVCDLRVIELLQAAHIIPKEENGSDDPRNGLVLCANHHLAFDEGLIAITPGNLALGCRPSGPSAEALGMAARRLEPLRARPHEVALTWRYTRWKERYAADTLTTEEGEAM